MSHLTTLFQSSYANSTSWRNTTGINYATGFQNTSGILNLAAMTLLYSSDNLSRCQKVTFLSVILLLFAISVPATAAALQSMTI